MEADRIGKKRLLLLLRELKNQGQDEGRRSVN